MCRLFAYRSNRPELVHHALLTETNSLRFQSREHPDGWGIASWAQPHAGPNVLRGLASAHSDPAFARASQGVHSHAVLAHLRLASVGPVVAENLHPFVHGPWAFAHNGTLQAFDLHREVIESQIDPDLRAHLVGGTDSERCFYLFLTLMRRRAGRLEGVGLADVAWSIAQTMHVVSSHTDRPGRDPSAMNFLVSDGRLMAVSRRHRTLFFSDGTPRTGLPGSATVLDRFVLASERLSDDGPWTEVPEESVIGVDADLVMQRWTVPELVQG